MKKPIDSFKTLKTLCAALLALGMGMGAAGADAQCYYVSTTGDDASETPTDPATPLKTIEAALAKAVKNDTISVAEGTYELANTLKIDKAVKIQGSGWATCILTNTLDGVGAVKITAAATLKGFTITGGKLAAYMAQGAGVYMSNGTLANCRVTGNFWGTGSNKQMYGFGVYLGNANAKVTHCIIDHNGSKDMTRTNGGGIYAAAKAKIDNCLIANNEAGVSGGGIYLTADATFTNCTIADNYAVTEGAGSYGAFGTFINCVFKDNVAGGDGCAYAPDLYTTSDSKPVCNNCLFEKAVRSGSNNVVQDPVFSNAGDYALMPPSLAIDGGDDTVYTEGDLDLAGNPRVQGGHIDAGCYESDPLATACGFYASKYSGKAGDSITLHGGATGFADAIEYTWSLKNETTGAIVSVPSVKEPEVKLAPGFYSVKLSVSDGSATKAYERDNLIFIGPSVCYVDPDSTGAFPYDTAENAASTLEAAYDACADGGEIILAAKSISRTASFAISKPVTIRGSSVQGATVLAQTKNARVVYLNHPNAVLANVTITGGKADEGAGICVGGAGGLVTNCVISGNSSTAGSYGRGALHMYAGRATRCLITGNDGGGGGGYPAVTLYGAAVVECSVISNNTKNTGAWAQIYVKNGGMLDSCLISGNFGARGGGVYADNADATYRNCTITKNSTSSGAGGVRIEGAARAKFINCIIAGNTTKSGAADWSFNKTTAVDWTQYFKNCFFDTNPTGANPQSGDPGFSDADNNDFTLKASSKAMNAGTIEYGIGTYDLAGNDRVRGDAVDIGCYEADPYVLAVGFDCLDRAGFLGTAFAITSTVSGVKGATNYNWTISSPSLEEDITSNEAHPTITPTAEGWYTVSLTVKDELGEATSTVADYLHVAPRDIYVTQDAEGAEYPYDTPETATSDFATGWKEAIDGSIVHVSGLMILDSTLEMTKAVTVVGVNGRDVDTLTYNGSLVVRLNNAAAVLKGLKVTGGRHGIELVTNGGTVEDCISTGNDCGNDSYSSGAGVYLDSASGVVRRTIISKNKVGSGGGQNHSGGAGVFIKNGILESCLVSENLGGGDGDGVFVDSVNAKVRNCTIVENHQYNSRVGGGLFFYREAFSGTNHAEVVNCLIVSNTTTKGEIRNVWTSYVDDDDKKGACKPMTEIVSDVLLTCALDATNETAKADFQIPADSANAKIVGDPCFNKDGSYRLTKKTPESLRGCAKQQNWMVGTTDLYGKPRCDRFGVEPGCCQAPFRYGLLFIVQ